MTRSSVMPKPQRSASRNDGATKRPLVTLRSITRRAAPLTGRRISYDEIRDEFLKRPPRTAAEELHYFSEIGMFVFYRWQQIASDAGDGAPDETQSAGRWDECTDRDLNDYRTKSKQLIGSEIGRLRAVAFVQSIWKKLDSLQTLARGVSWTVKTVGEHFVGALGLLLFGLLFVWAFPHFARDLRSTVDQLLPQETRPAELVQNRQGPDIVTGNEIGLNPNGQ